MPSNIDTTKIITAADKAAVAAEARAAVVKADCETTIKAVLDSNTAQNLFGAMITGTMAEADKPVFAAGQGWVTAMIAESRASIAENRAPVWPAPPDGVADLAERY